MYLHIPILPEKIRLNPSDYAAQLPKPWAQQGYKKDVVVRSDDFKMYKSLKDDNSSKPEQDPLSWHYLGYASPYDLFDASNTSVKQAPKTIKFSTLKTDSLFVFGAALTRRLTGTIKSSNLSINIDNSLQVSSASWSGYFFAQSHKKTSTFLKHAPLIKADYTLQTNDDKLSLVAVCKSYYLGQGLYGSKLTSLDLSKKSANPDGSNALIRASSRTGYSVQCVVSSSRVQSVYELLNSVRATPCIFTSNLSDKPFVLWGFVKSFDVGVNNSLTSILNLELQSLN